MAGPSIPKPIAGLLGKIGLRGGDVEGAQTGPGRAGPGGDADALSAEGRELQLGGELGPDGLLEAGLGYGGRDRRSHRRNQVELANVERFLSELEGDHSRAPTRGGSSPEGQQAKARSGDDRGGAEASPPSSREAETAAPDRPREDVLREHHVEVGAQGGPSTEARTEEEQNQHRGEGDPEGGSQGEGEDDDERPGWGWLAEEAELTERRRKFSLEGADLMGATSRCRGHLDDGSPCLRKPMDGAPYCREHRFG